jgi:cytidylyltransferase family
VLMSIPIVYLGSVERGWLGILMILLMAISNDTFGYIAGVNWGRHPMAPKISPKKSWEGLAGSIIGSALVAIVTLIIVGQPWWYGLLVAPVMVVASTAGDLMESVVKRRLGVKDMSNILPGHGGMMDRLDSILFAAAAGCLIFGTVMPL